MKNLLKEKAKSIADSMRIRQHYFFKMQDVDLPNEPNKDCFRVYFDNEPPAYEMSGGETMDMLADWGREMHQKTKDLPIEMDFDQKTRIGNTRFSWIVCSPKKSKK